jgi:ferredoxin
MSQRVFINEEECIGCGTCSELCPEVFQMNEEKEKAEVIKPEGGSFECITDAMEGCPVSCIHWEE